MMKHLFKYVVELTGNRYTSSIIKLFTKSRLSQPFVQPFSKIYSINTSEMEYPIGHYKTLHDFFTRRLTQNARKIDTRPNTLISPVDGVLTDMGHISANQKFYVKGQLYTLSDVFGSKNKAATYQDGYFFLLYLSPSHYHRFHYPIDGKLISRYALGEKSYPVNNLGIRFGQLPFSTNYRIISEFSTKLGKITMVKVGALNINTIQLIHSKSTFNKGEELGYFSFGSTVMLFIEKNEQHVTPLKNMNQEVFVGEPLIKW